MQAAKKGKILTFHWRGSYMTKEVMTECLKIFEEEAIKKEKHALVRINWSQAIVQVSFEKELSNEQLIEDKANEGEE